MGWLDTISAAIAVADEVKNADLKTKLVDVKLACVELAEELVRIREERNELREQLRLRDEMVWDQKIGAYFRAGTQGREEPFCPRCLDADKKVCRMAAWDQDFRCVV